MRLFADLRQLGYLREPGRTYTTLNPPDGAETKALGINDRGQVVGAYLDDGAVLGPDGRYRNATPPASRSAHGERLPRGT